VSYYLHHGEALAFIRTLPDACVDALVTDPPYSSGGQYKGDRTSKTSAKYQRNDAGKRFPDFSGDSRDQRGYLAWCTVWLSEVYRVLREGAPVVLFTDWRQLPTTTDALQCGGFTWRGVVPWNKPHPRPSKGRFAQGSEFVVWGSKGAMADDGPCHALTPWIFSPPHFTRKIHLTEKPVELLREIVRIVPPGGTVLDLFTGSGATGEACIREGRDFVGCELSAEYYALAKERLERLPSLDG
jgi:site-specific DNA-methyltransferase (adenine-specific)